MKNKYANATKGFESSFLFN